MSISAVERSAPHAIGVDASGNALNVRLSDGGTVSIPVDRYPRLAYATKRERANWSLIGEGQGIHWEDIDEDISVEGLLAGKRSGESMSSFGRWLMARRQPKFQPWKGKGYGKSNNLGLPARLLILGESHYGNPKDWDRWDRQTTVRVVREYCEEVRYPFFKKTMRTVLGPDVPADTSGQRIQFFDSVAFYNYVQSSVGDKHYIPPTEEMWVEAAPPFHATCKSLRPTHILACGWRLWDNIPSDTVWTTPPEDLIDWFDLVDFPGDRRAPKSILGHYHHSKGRSVVLAIPHPSRISYAWHPVVKRFLEYPVSL